MDYFTALDVGASALAAERTHMAVISMNLANVKTTRTREGDGPYTRKSVAYETVPVENFVTAMKSAMEREMNGVRVNGIDRDTRPPKIVYEPGHPDADDQGMVKYPDINIVEEMANMVTVMRSYEANATSINTVKAMYTKALELGR